MPAASVSGALTRCSQPRSRGLISPVISARSSASWSSPCRTDVVHAPEATGGTGRRGPRSRRTTDHGVYHRAVADAGRVQGRRTASALPGLRGADGPGAAGRPDPEARRRDARRQPPLGQGRRPRHGPRPPRRRRQHRAAARLVRGGRRRGRHAVAALDRQPQPARPTELEPLLEIIEEAVADRWPTSAAGGSTPSAPSTCCPPRPPRGSSRRPTTPATSTGCWSTSRSGTAAGARSPTPSGRCWPSTPPRAPASRSWPRSSTSSTSPTTSTPRASPTPTS